MDRITEVTWVTPDKRFRESLAEDFLRFYLDRSATCLCSQPEAALKVYIQVPDYYAPAQASLLCRTVGSAIRAP